MQLVADRFAIDEDGHALDLATGASVVLIVGSAGGVSEQMRWRRRCETLHSMWHHAIAPLVDFGLVGESSRFEAWSCGAPLREVSDHARSVHGRAGSFLIACGLSVDDLASGSLRPGRDGTVVWLPGAGSGYPLAAARDSPESPPLDARGLVLVDRPAVSTLAEMFQTGAGARPHVSALWGPAGSGKRVAVCELARCARAHGFVPIASRLVDSPYAALARGRSLFLVADATAGAAGTPWASFLDSALRGAQPHVFLVVSEDECRSIDGVAIGRVPADALVSAICPGELSERLEQVVRRAAGRAQGLPGRFVRLVWPASFGAEGSGMRRARRCDVPRVAERPAVYGREQTDFGPLVTPASPGSWPAPGELMALRRKLDGAIAHLAHGRHAPGIRQLRQAIGGLARRSAWADAGNGAIVLARALVGRGRIRDAQEAIQEARGYAARAGRDAMLVELATLSGETWIDLARLGEAEGVLGTALAAARAGRNPLLLAAAAIALARCLYWRGQYAEAAAALGTFDEGEARDTLAGAMRARHTLLASRVAVGQRDFNRAMSLATATGQQAKDQGAAAIEAAAASTMAFVHLAVGDLDAVDRDVARSIAAARTAHDPLRAVRARLLRAEAERRRGRPANAIAQLQRLRRVVATLPPMLRARWDLSMALATGGEDLRELVARHVAATGLGALVLYAADPRNGPGPGGGADPFVDEVVEVLRVCQTADEETNVLKGVCARVRQHLHAAAVAVVAVRGERAEILAGEGARLDTTIAERAVAAGITIAPHRHDDRIEAAAPVYYGGVAIGALSARWTVGSTYDTSRASSVLAMSAAAAAPVVSAALAAGRHAAVAGAGDLLGVTAAIVELRKSVQRAAAAPFAVVIDGESGSGKELVARAVHRNGPRRQRAFCTLNCAALPDDLVEAELFGHARGAFTGAVADRAGVFEEAHGGTLFLDEIGELSPRAQAKVLRVIQEGDLRRVGENVSRRVDVRIVSATNRDLRSEVNAGRFRLDLLYRLDVIHITVPPLRERREDIAVLAEHFWRGAAAQVGSRATLGAATLAALARYDWPGNVRELQNVLAALAVRSPKRGVIPPAALPAPFVERRHEHDWRLDEARRTFDERFVRAALVRTGGHRGRAATELGVTRQGLTKLMTRLGIAP